MEQKKTVYVIGDTRPDADTISSTLALAYLKNTLQEKGKTGEMYPGYSGQEEEEYFYQPVRCGQLDSLTEGIREYFGCQAPPLMEDVRTQIRDIDYSRVEPVSGNISLLEVWNRMSEVDKATMAVTGEDGQLTGVITMSDIAKSYMDVFDNRMLGEAGTCVKNIVFTLKGTIVTGDPDMHITGGKVLIAAANTQVLAGRICPGDVVILGNRYEAQLCAIEQGASVIIADNDAPISKTICKIAGDHGTVIIRTPYDAYDAARLISRSMPVRHFMTKDPVCFPEMACIDDIRDTMMDRRLRDFPVVDEDGRYLGTVSRRNLIDMDRKRVIMVNHNSTKYAVRGLGQAQITEIVDHHRMHSVQTMRPLNVRTLPTGSTAAITALMFEECVQEIPAALAGVLCCGILAATQKLEEEKSSDTDRRMAQMLALTAGKELEDMLNIYEEIRTGSRNWNGEVQG